MPSEEEKELDGLETNEDAGPGKPLLPVSGAEKAQKKEKKLWPLALAVTLLVLGGGGFYALTGLKDTAHKLGSGHEYDQLAANSSIYDGKAVSQKQLDVFAGGEGGEEAGGGAAAGEAGRLNSALAREKGELVGGSGSGSPAGAGWQQGAQDPGAADKAAPQSAQLAGSMAQKLQLKSNLSSGPGGSKSKSAGGSTAGFEGSGTLVGKGSVQRETKDKTPKKAGKGSVLESLKGSFKASLYGARLSSQDSARGWISRAFDATEEASTAIEYDEKVKAKLDRVNPGAIPGFLRDQEVSAAEAKRLADSKVSKPKVDKEGTREALEEDKDYQQKKMAEDFASGMLNGLFAGVSGTGTDNAPPVSPGPQEEEGPQSLTVTDHSQGYGGFADPEDTQAVVEDELADWVNTNGYGAECGCTAAAPCCCLPQQTVANNCPMYGPFLPGDPCDFTMNSGVVTAGE
jgi:hypothetical protein